MSRKWIAVICILFTGQAEAQPYRNPHLPIGQRVTDLLTRMTVEEKVAQLRSTWSMAPRMTDKLLNDSPVMDSLFAKGIGMINPDFDNTPDEQVRYRNAIDRYLRTRTRLGNTRHFSDEAHHGLLAQQADVFPTSIGLGCSLGYGAGGAHLQLRGAAGCGARDEYGAGARDQSVTSRPPVGPDGRDLWRGPLSLRSHGERGSARFPGVQ